MSIAKLLDCHRMELDGIRYVILRESVFEQLCEKAGIAETNEKALDENLTPAFDIDRASLSEKLRRRRRAAGLTQAELARRAGVRTETLNRIERGHTEPDFTTIRKLVLAMNEAERSEIERQMSNHQGNVILENGVSKKDEERIS
jgi:DNA-binding XRE family transcriptional regulator